MHRAIFAGATLILALGARADDEAIRQAVTKLAPQLEVKEINDSVLPGMKEVVLSNEVVYISEDGRYLIQGSVYDMETRLDVTEQRRSGMRHDALAQISPDKEITFPAADQEHEVTVFTDIDCGYCRRFHQQIADYNDRGITVHYLFFPRAGLQSHSYDKAVSVWCAEDQRTALTRAKAGQEPDPRQCDNPVEEQYNLGHLVGVTGTPTIIMQDGTLLGGYLPPDALAARLDLLQNVADSKKQAQADTPAAR